MIVNRQRPLPTFPISRFSDPTLIEQLSGAAGGSPGASPIANSLASVVPPTAMTNPTMGPQLLNNIFSAPAANPIPKSGLVPWMVLGPVMKKIREGRGMF